CPWAERHVGPRQRRAERTGDPAAQGTGDDVERQVAVGGELHGAQRPELAVEDGQEQVGARLEGGETEGAVRRRRSLAAVPPSPVARAVGGRGKNGSRNRLAIQPETPGQGQSRGKGEIEGRLATSRRDVHPGQGLSSGGGPPGDFP